MPYYCIDNTINTINSTPVCQRKQLSPVAHGTPCTVPWGDCARDVLCPGHLSLLQFVHDTLEYDMLFYGKSTRHATVFVINNIIVHPVDSACSAQNTSGRNLSMCTKSHSTFMTSSTDVVVPHSTRVCSGYYNNALL